jgi:hypothetical protein
VPRHVARLVTRARRTAHRRLLRLRRASGCRDTSRGSSRGSSRRSSSTTPPRAGSSSTTSPPPRVWVPRHVARHVTRLVAPLVVDYSASRRVIVDYFASTARPGAATHRATRRAARRRLLRLAQARRRLLRLRRASGCLGTSRGTSRGSSCCSSSTTLPRAGSSSTTSPPPRVRVPRHVARLVMRLIAPLVVDHFAYIARLGALLIAQLIVDYFTYVVRSGASAPRAVRRRPRAIFAARLLVGRSHWLSPYAGHSVSRLGYSLPGCTGSTAYVVHSDAPSSLLDNSTPVASTVCPGSTAKSFI